MNKGHAVSAPDGAPAQLLELKGIRENNLKSVALKIRHDQLTVVTGISGSGKSSLAFDTIYAEGGRRYIETFSPYTRQFLDRLHRPDLDTISGVRPALALEQRNRMSSSRSTVGTITEINDYLKIIWAHLASLVCPKCSTIVERNDPQHVRRRLLELLAARRPALVVVGFPLPFSGEASSDSLAATLAAEGFIRYFSPRDKRIKRIEEVNDEHVDGDAQLMIVADRIKFDAERDLTPSGAGGLGERLRSSVAQAYVYGHGQAFVLFDPGQEAPEEFRFADGYCCSGCGEKYPEPKAAFFTFNSPLGACRTCHGFGKVLALDPQLCVPNPSKSIAEQAVLCWATRATAHEFRKLKTFCSSAGIRTDVAWSQLPEEQKKAVLYGPAKKDAYKGLEHWFKKLERKRHKVHVRVFLSRFRREFTCSDCGGARIQPLARRFFVNALSLPDIWQLPIKRLLPFFENLSAENPDDQVTEIALEEVTSRLRYLDQIGLGYLTLDRQSRTLSGGEFQRVNLTSILGARLVHTVLVLDEPTIGLHAADTNRLIDILHKLKERGNTVVVVEHDLDVIRSADEVIDLGPLAGNAGGEIVYQGSVNGLSKEARSLTARYLSDGKQALRAPRPNRAKAAGSVRIKGASAHNLQNLDLYLPLRRFVAVSGVSGSGKSTLLHRCLYEPYQKLRLGLSPEELGSAPGAPVSAIEGLESLDDIVLIDQNPIGKTPRSNAGTYTRVWDLIRECFEETEEAQRLGLSKSAFSFNVDGGRCPVCKGAGQLRIEMQFLADVFIPCEACGGARFQDKVLSVLFAGKSVLDFLKMSLYEVSDLIGSLGMEERGEKIQSRLKPLIDLGLGYLRLGHPLSAVSGGEAQRIKLAAYLQPGFNEKCLFILDEPTTGLHPHNVADLIKVFSELTARGHSLAVIEHNLDVLRQADWIVDLGPGGGEEGGWIVAQGAPEELADRPERFPQSQTARLLAGQFERRGQSRQAKLPAAASGSGRGKAIEVIGARHHNLQNVSVDVPHNTLTVVTGVSGSGKSTLAFDIIFAEGQRRYIDCLSPYARQYIKQLARADVDRVNYIPPTIAISQKTAPPLGVSTVATITELYQYLRLLYAKVGTQHCVEHDEPITSLSSASLCAEIARRFSGKRIFLYAPVVAGRKGFYNELFIRALKAEITEARIDGKVVRLEPELRLDRHKLHWISLAVGSLKNPSADSPLLRDAIEQCLLLGNGAVEVFEGDAWGEPVLFSIARVCPQCGRGYRELDPQDFSFRSARGVCKRCGGAGKISEGKNAREQRSCPECGGARIGPIGRHVYVNGRRIHELTAMNAGDLLSFIEQLRLPERLSPIIAPILQELKSRLSVILSVGLGYLELDRDACSISGGEAQRLRLARALGSPLSGVCYVLDEPSIGLHAQDQDQLMQTLFRLRDQGNTVLVVEHDEETIRQADHIIDVGPKGGADGGTIVARGTVAEIEACPQSLTGQALRERAELERRGGLLPSAGAGIIKQQCLSLRGAVTNNLRRVNVDIPLARLTVVAGVSGAGKSSLVHGTLVPALVEEFEGQKEREKYYSRSWEAIENVGTLSRMIEIDQSPPGKTSTSTPASFLGVFDDIRKIYAMLPEAKARGWNASYFSFNTGKGRCSECQGKGVIKVPMSFLPDAVNNCESCNGSRYNDSTLEVLYQGLSVGELLQKTVTEARQILANHRSICRSLDYVLELGLGYLTLGQPTHTLSGGEVQRLKIARELGLREAKDTLYILDEPTIGLHMVDVDKLRAVLARLVGLGNTVVVIEHNLDLIRAADYLVELGPGPGERGGKIVFSGPPARLIHSGPDTPTRHCLTQSTNRSAAASAPAELRRVLKAHSGACRRSVKRRCG